MVDAETITESKNSLKDERIKQYDKVLRAICTELGMTYGGVDVDSGEIVENIKLLIKQSSYFEQSHLTVLKDINVLHEQIQQLQKDKDDLSEKLRILDIAVKDYLGCEFEKNKPLFRHNLEKAVKND